jgi:leader peptidase (prepilin peptidase)/N-methyltransferase
LVLVNDLEHRVVLFQVSIAGLVICFVYGYFLHGIWSTLIGGLVGFAIMYLLYLGGGWFTKLLSKRRGEEVTEIALGFGDVNISAVIGLLLGWPAITAGLMIGILAGGLISGLFLLVMVLLRRYQPLSALPYTPFLILGAVVLLFIKG